MHELANMIGYAHHSVGQGKGGANRRVIVYPKGVFLAEEEREKEKLAKNKEKIKREFKDYNFIGASQEPKTFREMVIKEVYD